MARWWRTGDRTLKRLELEQRRRAWALERYDVDELAAALERLLAGRTWRDACRR